MSKQVNVSTGMSFPGTLTIVFIVLKLTGNIGWSWFWVLSPMIFSIGLGILFFLVMFVIFMVTKKGF